MGTTPPAKNPNGYVKVMVPPTGMPVNGVKLKVIETEAFPATRSVAEMLRATDAGMDVIAGYLPVNPRPRITPKCTNDAFKFDNEA